MPGAFGSASVARLTAAAEAEPGTDGVDLVGAVTTRHSYQEGDGPLRVVAYDLGIKEVDCRTTVRNSNRNSCSCKHA